MIYERMTHAVRKACPRFGDKTVRNGTPNVSSIPKRKQALWACSQTCKLYTVPVYSGLTDLTNYNLQRLNFCEFYTQWSSISPSSDVLNSWRPSRLHRLAIFVSPRGRKPYLMSHVDRTDETTVFSVLELIVLATTLLENFEFSLPPQTEKTRIYRKPSFIMYPMVEDQPGSWMGLVVKALK